MESLLARCPALFGWLGGISFAAADGPGCGVTRPRLRRMIWTRFWLLRGVWLGSPRAVSGFRFRPTRGAAVCRL